MYRIAPMDDIPISPESPLFAAGRGANETADDAMDYAEKVMEVAAVFGGAEAAAALLAGGGAELGAGAAAAGGATVGSAVVGSFAAGYGIGTTIDEWTGASDKLSTAAVDVNRERARRRERLGRCRRGMGSGRPPGGRRGRRVGNRHVRHEQRRSGRGPTRRRGISGW
jgi:hypothetical protein